MAGCESSRLVEEEQFCEATRLLKRLTVPVFELQPAGNPTLAVKAPTNSPVCIMQAAAVAVHEPARRVCDELAERRDTILERHVRGRGSDLGVRAGCDPGCPRRLARARRSSRCRSRWRATAA